MIIVKTTGPFEIQDPMFDVYVSVSRPHVVRETSFVHQRLGTGQLKTLASDLPESANDKDFADYWAEAKGDEALAVESYAASLKPAKEPTKQGGSKANK